MFGKIVVAINNVLERIVSFVHPEESCSTFPDGRVVWDHDVVAYLKKHKRLKWYDRFRLQRIVTEASWAFAEMTSSMGTVDGQTVIRNEPYVRKEL